MDTNPINPAPGAVFNFEDRMTDTYLAALLQAAKDPTTDPERRDRCITLLETIQAKEGQGLSKNAALVAAKQELGI